MPPAVRVRMYRVGFGDCFLVTFPGPLHMVVDCGSASATGEEALRRAVEDIAQETEGHVHVVVASHRRLEHVSGFEQEAKRWKAIAVDEVWMPWTEDPADAEAADLRDRLDRIAALLARDGDESVRRIAAVNASRLAAFDVLHDGFHGGPRRRFLVPKDAEVDCPGLPGLHVRLLAPVRSPASLRRLEIESSFALSTAERPDRDRGPFGRSWRLSGPEVRSLFGPEIRERDPASELSLSEQTTEELAFWLDKTVSNSSLVLLLRFGRARLLFPGDAQWDSWLPIVGWEELQAEIGQVGFYKVSQHGSHNGTPLRLERYLGKTVSAVSTEAGPWPAIPHPPLLRTLREHGDVVRSDRAGARSKGARRRERWIDFEVPC